MLRIPSDTGGHWAVLKDDPEGIRVEVWRRIRNSNNAAARLDVWVLPCPWHVARDVVHALMHDLPDEAPYTGGRR